LFSDCACSGETHRLFACQAGNRNKQDRLTAREPAAAAAAAAAAVAVAAAFLSSFFHCSLPSSRRHL